MEAIAIWLIILVVLPFILFFIRILLMAWKSVLLSKRIKNLSREVEARQGQIPTVSGSVDANSVISSDPPSTSQSCADAHFKVDLPPTYDEVMKHFLEAKEATAAASSETNASLPTTTSTHGIDAIDIEDPPPPQYSSVQSS